MLSAFTKVIFACLVAIVSDATFAECHLRYPTVVMCQIPKNAANAYQAFGGDDRKMKESYNLELLHESWCSIVSEPRDRSLKFLRFSEAKIATQTGWVPVTQIGFRHDGLTDVRYVTTGYLRGECDRYVYDPNHANSDNGEKPNPDLPTMQKYQMPDDMGAVR